MVVRDTKEIADGLSGGVVAGLIGGVVLALFMLLANAVKGAEIWPVLKGAGAPFMGERALESGFDFAAIVIGVVSHFFVSAVWGAVFGLLVYGFSKRNTILLGLAFGIVVWLGMDYVVLPIVGLSEMASASPIGMAIFQHVLFGGAVAVGFLPFQRQVPRARPLSLTLAGR